MSKAVLVMDMPKCCDDCQFFAYIHFCVCLADKGRFIRYIEKDKKPEWCPLRELPEYKEEIDEPMPAYYRAEGWNDCLYEITGGAEE